MTSSSVTECLVFSSLVEIYFLCLQPASSFGFKGLHRGLEKVWEKGISEKMSKRLILFLKGGVKEIQAHMWQTRHANITSRSGNNENTSGLWLLGLLQRKGVVWPGGLCSWANPRWSFKAGHCPKWAGSSGEKAVPCGRGEAALRVEGALW